MCGGRLVVAYRCEYFVHIVYFMAEPHVHRVGSYGEESTSAVPLDFLVLVNVIQPIQSHHVTLQSFRSENIDTDVDGQFLHHKKSPRQ